MYEKAERHALEALGIRGRNKKTNQLYYKTEVKYNDDWPEPLNYIAKEIKVIAKDKEDKDKEIVNFNEENYKDSELHDVKRTLEKSKKS